VYPYRHAIGFLSSRVIIDLRNYEASKDHFSTRFQPERSPFPALGTLPELEDAPPVFDVARYERETHGRVDYILFQGGASADSDGNGIGRLERTLYRSQIANYTLVSSGQRGDLRLYERGSPSAQDRAGAGEK
jgi:hypothetical protein